MNNRLTEWLKLYDEQMGPMADSRMSDSPWVSADAQRQQNNANASNARGARMTGALALMNEAGGQQGYQEPPEFFGGGGEYQPPAYVQPQRSQGTQPQRQRDPRMMNYLAQMLRPQGGR